MSETGPDPVASAMAGAILGVEEELAEATEVYWNMYAEAYWSAFGDLKGRVGSNVVAALGEDLQVLFHVFIGGEQHRRTGQAIASEFDSRERRSHASTQAGQLMEGNGSRSNGP